MQTFLAQFAEALKSYRRSLSDAARRVGLAGVCCGGRGGCFRRTARTSRDTTAGVIVERQNAAAAVISHA
jgi:hypothetical protein